MNDSRILSIDCGTQSIRAIIFDKNGYIIENEKIEFEPYFSKNPGWAEQNPETYWKSLCLATNKLKNKNIDEFNKINGVVVTTLRNTMVNIDKNGNVLRPTITWLDQRTAKKAGYLSNFEKLALLSVGMKKTVHIISKESKALWIKENEPNIWNKTYKYLQVSGYLNFKLTDNFRDSIASQIGHIPLDYKKQKWIDNKNHFKWRMFGINENQLPEIISSGEIIGKITEKASIETGLNIGIKVFAGGSDKGCETIGNGCLNEYSASLSFGTTATIQITTNKYIEPIKFMPSYPSIISKNYNPEVEIFRGYWMIKWFKNQFALKETQEAIKMNISPEELLNNRLEEISPGSDGLILQPYWGPHAKTPNAKGSIIGFGDIHTRIHIYRAIIEGINYGLIDGLKMIEKKTNKKIKYLIVCGGGSQSDTICQITSDMFNLPVKKIHTHEASSLGASIIGYKSINVYSDFYEAINNMVHYKKEFYPNKSNTKIYNDIYYKIYKKIYPKLKSLYNNLSKII